jgi:hypothetical protein
VSVLSIYLPSFRISQKNCDELQTHPGFPLRAADRARSRMPFIRYPHAFNS